MGKLTALKIKNAQSGKYEDGDGLRLVVSTSKAKKWVYRYTLNGRRREMGIGSNKDVSLADARELVGKYRTLIRQGKDPIEVRKLGNQTPETHTFTSCAAHYIRKRRHEWSNPKHARQWCATLKTYARPLIGTKSIDMIQTDDILQVLQPIWNTKTETAKRVQGRIENILDFAAAHEWRDPINPARWRGHLDKILPRPTKIKKVKNHPAMPYDELPEFMSELENNDSISSLALQWLILTCTRTNETLQSQWAEIDLDKAVWIIPSERMKAKREHRVPLSDSTLSILESLPRFEGNPFVFPGARHNRPLSNMALLQLMRGMGYGVNGNRGNYVPHGFRSSFRDWAGEVSSYPRDVCEMALAHTIQNKTEAAYRRGDLFDKRRVMMQAWADWCKGDKEQDSIPLQVKL
jgi:integrase